VNSPSASTSSPAVWATDPAVQTQRVKSLLQADRAVAELDGSALVQQGVAALLGWQASFKKLARHNAICQRSYLLQQSLQPFWDSLSHDLWRYSDQAGKPFLIFKGQALAHVLYPTPAVRARSDLDVLVQREDRQAWQSWLAENGFYPVPSRQGRWVSQQNSFVKPLAGHRRLLVDLHWEINNRPEFHRRLPFSRLHTASVLFDDGAHQLPTLSPRDALQLAVFHYFAHRPEHRKHLWLYDIALLWPRRAKQPENDCSDADFLPEMHGLLVQMQQRLEQVFPGQDFLSFHQNRPVRRSSFPAFLPYTARRRRKLPDFWRRWKSQPSWRARFGLVSDYLFQPRSYVQGRYAVEHAWQVWFYYPRMWLSDLWRLLKKTNTEAEESDGD